MDLDRSYRIVTPNGSRESTLRDVLSASTKTLLYFYPKDNTPGCTMEAQDFTRAKGDFAKA